MLAATARLARIVLMVRPGEALQKSTEFYQQGIGLTIVRATDEWAELRGGGENQHQHHPSWITIALHAVASEAQVSTGYSPLLQFQIQDMDNTVAKCVQLGGHLDGPIQYPAHGKVAALRSPDGHMIGLYEPAE